MEKSRQSCRKLSLVPVAVFLLLFLAVCRLFAATPVQAASKPAQITECRLISAGKIRITVQLDHPEQISGKKCYLFEAALSRPGLTADAKPIQSKTKARKMTFTVSLNRNRSDSRLYSRFFLAVKNSSGTYSAVSSAKYISNPGRAAKYTYRFPTAVSKKGLQVSAAMTEDAVELNVHHSVLNIVFSDLISRREEYNRTASIPYKYHGKTYWFRRSVVESYDSQLEALKETKAIISGILLLGWRDDLTYLIYPSGRSEGHAFYAWNTSGTSAREHLEAAIAFLAGRYSTPSGKYGQIVNWIVGNEVNNYNVYNYAGRKNLTQYSRIYANAFRLTYNTVTSIYANARVYISLDHLWNYQTAGSFPSRNMLDAFAKALKRQGSIPWNLAYHPYGSPLTEPKFWENINQQVTQALTSPVINMANIGILTSYIRDKYGSTTRVILSEQGFSSVRHTSSGNMDAEKDQAAAIAYGYYLAEEDDMVDAFIINRQVDHRDEVSQGLDLGLWKREDSSRSPEWASEAKTSWSVFKYMDTNRAAKVTAPVLSVIGIEKWSDVIEGFGSRFYTKTTVDRSALKQVKSYKKRGTIPTGWKQYGAVTGGGKSSGVLYVSHDGSRNRSCVWGFSQKFKKGLNFQSNPVFYTSLQVKGAQAGKVRVKLRFFSGNHIMESYGKIAAGRKVSLGVSLKNWKYRSKVTKIQVLIAPVKGGWEEGASLAMNLPVQGR